MRSVYSYLVFAFSIPLFIFVPEITTKSKPMGEAVRAGCKELFSTLKKLPREKTF